jgi:thiamine biosynthesis lipoprotein
MKQFVVLLLLTAVLLWAGEPFRIEDSVDAMGTTFTVIAYADGRQQLEQGLEAAFTEVRRLEGMLSNYASESEWSRVNRLAAEGAVPVSRELFDLLAECIEFSRRSEGTFDITVGPLMRVWGFYKGSGRMPEKAEVARAETKVGYRNIVLDGESRTVRFRSAGVEMDPGGIGKGYAVDKMIEKLKEHGIGSALVTAGGSSIYALGAPPNDSGWTVRIRHPRKWSQTVEELQIKDESMSTSGDYEKFFAAEGKIYSHIMDPRTGYPSNGALSVSVVAPRTLTSEAWTKPFFILGRQWTARNKSKELRVHFCEDETEVKCAWLQ